MSQTFPVPTALAALLDNRTGTPANPVTGAPAVNTVTYNGVVYTPANAPFLANVSTDQLGFRTTDNFTNTFQVVAGFEGTIPGTDFTWDVTGSHGETVAKSNQSGFVDAERWRAVLNAPNYGYNSQFFGNASLPGARFNGGSATCTSGINPFLPTPELECGLPRRHPSGDAEREPTAAGSGGGQPCRAVCSIFLTASSASRWARTIARTRSTTRRTARRRKARPSSIQ